MKFNVGQIVYLLSTKDIKIYPAQITEEINRKTLSGAETSYIVKLPDKNKTEISLEKISAEIFISIDALEKKMIKNASDKIRLILDQAKNLEQMFEIVSNDEIKNSETLHAESDGGSAIDGPATVDLGNGIKANINLDQIENIGVKA